MNLLTQCMDGLNSTNTATAEDFILRSGYATAADNSLYNGAQPSVYLPSIDHYSIAPNGGLVHKNGPFKCDKCPAVFMLEVFFQLHAKKHSESERALEAQAGNAKQRRPNKSGKKRFKQRNKTAGDSVQGLFCRRCRITAPTFEELLRHMAQHSASKEPSQCGNCDYVTMNRGNFKRHIMTHGNIRPFKCHMCPFSASQKTHLNKHMRYHCGNREFQCDLCSYNCSDKANFNRHKNLHPINSCNSGNANVTPNTMVRQSGGIGGGSSSGGGGGIAGGSQQNNCGQCTNTMAQLSTKQDPTCTTTQTATTLTDHMNQVVAMTTADVAMAADIAMTTRDVMSRQLDITRLFKNVGQDLSHEPHPSGSSGVDPMVSMISNPRNIN